MRKDELRKLRTLTATPQMMRLAAEDIPKKTVQKTYWGTEYVREMTEYGLLLRCQVLKGILEVSFFLPDAMRLGGRLPAYELYINKETADFITYDRGHDRWLTAKLDRIDWPRAIYSSRKHWIDPEGYASIKRYLGTEKGGYEGILDYQLSVRKKQLKARHKRETDPWDKDLAQTPALPKDWDRWADKVGIRDNYIFYKYVRSGAKTGWCSFCGREVPILRPRHNKQGRCRRCRHEVTFKAAGRLPGQLFTSEYDMYLLQRCADGLMIRQFRGRRQYKKAEWKAPKVHCQEIRRAIFSTEARPLRAYYWGDYKHSEFRWIEAEPCSPNWRGNNTGRCYGKTLPSLAARELRCTGLPEMIRAEIPVDPEKYLAVLDVAPMLEQLVKAKLYGLVKDCLKHPYFLREKLSKPAAGSLAKRLGIDGQELGRLRKTQGGFSWLKWLRVEKSSGKMLPDQTIRWLCQEEIEPDGLQFILDRMSVQQTVNYVRRQMRETGVNSWQVLTTWKDYLSMAARLKMDTGDAIIYRVRRLRRRHDELVEQMRTQELSIEASEILERFPHLEEIFTETQTLYAYQGKEYSVVVPTQVEQILREGRELHHCVGSSGRYWERIERRESYILFLRRTAEPEKAYYTLEAEPDGTVRQKRTMYDRQAGDIGAVTAFLQEWQKEVAKRLTEKERQLAAASRSRRAEELLQLQKDGVLIRTGDLRGKLLADVLMSDLMENPENEQEAAQAEMPAAA